MKKIYLIVWGCFNLLCSFVYGQQIRLEKIDTLIQCINNKDSQALLLRMSDTCTIGNLPVGDNARLLPVILKNFKPISSYRINRDTLLSDGNSAFYLDVIYADGKSGKPGFEFNEKGKLVKLNIIKAQLSADPVEALDGAVAKADLPDTMQVAFKLVNGLIYVPTRLNGQSGFFLLDSGSPVVILRNKYVDESCIRKGIRVDLMGMGGNMPDVSWATDNQLEWGSIRLLHFDAPVAPMDDMELTNDTPIFGLIGYSLFQDYQLTFDYQHQLLLLEKVDSLGNLVGASFSKGKLQAKSTMEMKRHIPIVRLHVGAKEYALGIDCGANANVLQENLKIELADHFEEEQEEMRIDGVGGSSAGNQVGYLIGAKMDNLPFQDMYTVYTDQEIGAGTGKDRLPIVGLLGTPFLNQYKTTLNFKKKEISFY